MLHVPQVLLCTAPKGAQLAGWVMSGWGGGGPGRVCGMGGGGGGAGRKEAAAAAWSQRCANWRVAVGQGAGRGGGA